MNGLSVSNIAWSAEQDEEAFAGLKQRGVTGIDVAPSRIWPGWEGATPEAGRAFRQKLADMGLEIPAFQALLYGVTDVAVFGSEAQQQKLCDHIAHVADLAEAMGAKLLVFGSPKNRQRGERSQQQAVAAAIPVFRRLGEICAARGVVLGLEPNPPEYSCDFVTRTHEAIELVEAVDSPGFGLHLDTGDLTLTEAQPQEILEAGLALARHFHVSEPFLGHFAEPQGDHSLYGRAVSSSSYAHWISIEMRSTGALQDVYQAVDFVRRHYPVAERS